MATTIHLQSQPSPAGPGHVHPCPECHAQRPCDDARCTHFPELAPADETRRGAFVVCAECELRRAPYVVVELVQQLRAQLAATTRERDRLQLELSSERSIADGLRTQWVDAETWLEEALAVGLAECERLRAHIDALAVHAHDCERTTERAEVERDEARAALSIARRLLALPHLARCDRYGCAALATKGGGATPWSAWTSCDAHAGLLTGVVEELPQAADVRALAADDTAGGTDAGTPPLSEVPISLLRRLAWHLDNDALGESPPREAADAAWAFVALRPGPGMRVYWPDAGPWRDVTLADVRGELRRRDESSRSTP